jgi:small neutral amino acid transporter SnatA (MarC family)
MNTNYIQALMIRRIVMQIKITSKLLITGLYATKVTQGPSAHPLTVGVGVAAATMLLEEDIKAMLCGILLTTQEELHHTHCTM